MWGIRGSTLPPLYNFSSFHALFNLIVVILALIPFNINSMSIFSFSLRLCIDGDFVHPRYQMDDIICLIRWMGVTKRRIRIPMIPVPAISGPTNAEVIGKNIFNTKLTPTLAEGRFYALEFSSGYC